jgi:7,8-dihydropterin-6-yl-methyl-4-(beta-D-ribofuranosyl)aminobenzene 5'-phosphate synthase
MNGQERNIPDLTIAVVYDNNNYRDELQTGWGFSCLLTDAEKVTAASEMQ